MHLELADLLRCIAPHESTPLVASSDRSLARAILDGTLGCPLCGAEYRIVGGVVRYVDAPAVADAGEAGEPDLDHHAARTAALLDATDSRARYLLVGATVALARAIQRLVPVGIVLVNPPDEALAGDVAGHHDEPLAVVRCGNLLPVAAGSMRGAYVAPGAVGAAVPMERVVATLREGGRLVAPVALPLPDGVAELVRDDREWVAERRGEAPPPAIVTLRRRASR